jgi:small-conductance mechanosensitive channel
MEKYEVQLIESAVVILAYLIIRYLILKAIENVTIRIDYQKSRTKIIIKIVTSILFLICLSFLIFIWGVKQSELVLFISSMLTVVGIAFFAQWSLMSNITSTLIIFFSHTVKIGDSITVYDKDYPIEGTISDIGIFFVVIKTDEGEKITIASNVFIQKMVKQRNKH